MPTAPAAGSSRGRSGSTWCGRAARRYAGSRGAPTRSIPRDLPQKPLGEVNFVRIGGRCRGAGAVHRRSAPPPGPLPARSSRRGGELRVATIPSRAVSLPHAVCGGGSGEGSAPPAHHTPPPRPFGLLRRSPRSRTGRGGFFLLRRASCGRGFSARRKPHRSGYHGTPASRRAAGRAPRSRDRSPEWAGPASSAHPSLRHSARQYPIALKDVASGQQGLDSRSLPLCLPGLERTEEELADHDDRYENALRPVKSLAARRGQDERMRSRCSYPAGAYHPS